MTTVPFPEAERRKAAVLRACGILIANQVRLLPPDPYFLAGELELPLVTLSELAVQGKACLLIPSPYVTANHQYKNARVLADAGAALLIEEKDLTPERVTAEIGALLEDDNRRGGMEKAIGAFARRDANKVIYAEICRLVKAKKA